MFLRATDCELSDEAHLHRMTEHLDSCGFGECGHVARADPAYFHLFYSCHYFFTERHFNFSSREKRSGCIVAEKKKLNQ